MRIIHINILMLCLKKSSFKKILRSSASRSLNFQPSGLHYSFANATPLLWRWNTILQIKSCHLKNLKTLLLVLTLPLLASGVTHLSLEAFYQGVSISFSPFSSFNDKGE